MRSLSLLTAKDEVLQDAIKYKLTSFVGDFALIAIIWYIGILIDMFSFDFLLS